MSETCTCTESSVDGHDIHDLTTWELALRNAAHGHYEVPALILRDAVREIDRLRALAALLLDRAESYQRDAGVIRQTGLQGEAVAYETIAAELRRVAEEVGRG